MNLYSFEADYNNLLENIDLYVESVFSTLESDFLIMPKGNGFIEYQTFEGGYEILKGITNGFRSFKSESIKKGLLENPMIFIVLRTILGFTPPEWAYVASGHTHISITQTQIRSLDRFIRLNPLAPLELKSDALDRLDALILTACELLKKGAPLLDADRLHRLDKADTKYGISDLQRFSDMGVPYAMLLYERFLGRPFAGHRDSVSELIGDGLENAIEEVLMKAKMSFRKTKRAEKIPGFDQAPDFILPSEFNPEIVIEAKITEDDGTARDKITRIQHLSELSEQFFRSGKRRFPGQ
ncbi:hypothetical protein AGMMS49940_23870 [Spirochaetia bacterium]|nr:hypothetical protein AGMMS49940_23870 [Spirochaetia bacterium]